MDRKGESQLSPKLLKRFYEVLILLRVLRHVQGERIVAAPADESNLDFIEETEMRRKVMYHLCVMCDFLKGGFTVTAIAAEYKPAGPQYWVASNSSLKKIVPFLRAVLKLLEARTLPRNPQIETSSFEEQLFQIFASFQQRRTKKCWKILQTLIERELSRAQQQVGNLTQGSEYDAWLLQFQSPITEATAHFNLPQLAYENRHSGFLRADFDPVTGQPTSLPNESQAKIRHYIGRLSSLRRAAHVLAYAATSHAQLFHGFSVQAQDGNTISWRPSSYPGLTVAGISSRMFPSDSTELNSFREALKSLDENGSVMSQVQDYYDGTTWQPRVHAELILLETLHARQIRFYNDDKYIACSKPACFCCYHYICSHPGSFARPPCHNKTYSNWQPPDLPSTSSPRQLNEQRDTMNKLIFEVRQAVIQRVLRIQAHAKWHPDSTTGITPMDVTDAELAELPIVEDDAGVSDHQHDPDDDSGLDLGDTITNGEKIDSDDDSDGGVALIGRSPNEVS